MLAHGDCLLDEAVKILRDCWCETVNFEDAENLATGDHSDLANSVGIPQDGADLGWGETLASKFANKFANFGGCGFQP